jgi:hypothetical protein
MKHISIQSHDFDINAELCPMSLLLEIFLHYVKMSHMINKYKRYYGKRKSFSTKIIKDVHYCKCQSKNKLEMK